MHKVMLAKKAEGCKLSEGELRLLEWQYAPAGLSSAFNTALFRLIGVASKSNLKKLAMGFPEEVFAFENFVRTEGYWKRVQEEAKKLYPWIEVGM